MQRSIRDKEFLEQNVSRFDNAVESEAIDRAASNYNDAKENVQKIRELVNIGNYDTDIAKYIPGVPKSKFKECLRISTLGKKKLVHLTRTWRN